MKIYFQKHYSITNQNIKKQEDPSQDAEMNSTEDKTGQRA
jgi:hypothetical protein